MEFLNEIWSIQTTMINIAGYSLSYIEFLGTVFGLFSVWLATKANWHTWTTGLINVIAFFIIYYQIQLYSDMFLQVFFLGCSFLGIYQWLKMKPIEDNTKISSLSKKHFFLLMVSLIVSTIGMGYLVSNIHIYAPVYFSKPAAYPYLDALSTVLSISATFLMIYKKVECWYLWIIVDIISIALYYKKGILFISIEYLIFLIMASWGLIQWQKLIQHEKGTCIG